MRFRFPHALVLLVGGILLAAALTWVVPAGEYERHEDPVTHKKVVVAGTYHQVERSPVGPFDTFVQIPNGLIDAADIVFFVFLAGGAFAVVDKTGTLRQAVDWLADGLQGRGEWMIPVVCVIFAVGGALENLQEEILAMVPALLFLCRRLGFDPLTAVAMSIGAAHVGAAFSPVNPFQAVIAQQLAGVPKISAWGYRLAFMVPALVIWIWGVRRYARRAQSKPTPEEPPSNPAASEQQAAPTLSGVRVVTILLLIAGAFVVFIYGVTQRDWEMSQAGAVFFLAGTFAGFVGRLGLNGTAEAFVEGFSSMAFGALLIGFARAIYIVLSAGHVVDTLVAAMFAPLAHLPVGLSAVGMLAVQTVLHFPVPSVSGQAVLTMPILVPLADLLKLSRQVVVLAYQYGAGLCELLTPTNGALMAILSASKVRFSDWLRFTWPLYLALVVLGLFSVLLAIGVGLH